jgi:signal peptidase II
MTAADDDAVVEDEAVADDVAAEPSSSEPSSSGTESVVTPRASRLPLSLTIAAVVLVLDQWSKRWALNALADGRSRHVFWIFDWNLTFNSGMAFSKAQGVGPYIGAVALIVIVVMLLSLRRSGGLASSIAVGLVVGGAVGNIADRLFRGPGWLKGSVIDFIDPRVWPIFNVADMGVTIGGVLLVLASMTQSRTAR